MEVVVRLPRQNVAGPRGAQVTPLGYLSAIDALVARRDALEATIAELVPSSPWADTVARLRCPRGIDTLTAVGLCAEIGDFERFARPAQPPGLSPVPAADRSRAEPGRRPHPRRAGRLARRLRPRRSRRQS